MKYDKTLGAIQLTLQVVMIAALLLQFVFRDNVLVLIAAMLSFSVVVSVWLNPVRQNFVMVAYVSMFWVNLIVLAMRGGI